MTLRVLYAASDPRIGGPQIRALAVANELIQKDIETVFLVPRGSDAFADRARNEGFDVVRAKNPRIRSPRAVGSNVDFLLSMPSVAREIRSIIDSYEIDIVHNSQSINLQPVFGAVRAGVPVAWHFTDTQMPWPLAPILSRLAERYADEVVVVADAVHDHYFGGNRVGRKIYEPVNKDRFDPKADEKSFDFIGDAPVIGTVGNLNPAKGHKYLLQAVARLRDRGDSAEVIIAGAELESQSRYAKQIKELRKDLGLEDIVHFVGWQSDIPRLLAGFDVFTLPSVTEAFPISVLEAMAMERGIVATSVGGVPEQIVDGTHGWLVPPKDSKALANSLREAVGSVEERRYRGKAARERVMNQFTLKRCANDHLRLYEDLTSI